MPSFSQPAAGGGRWVEVAPERLERWLAGFVERHGAVSWAPTPAGLSGQATDGTTALVAVAFPPVARSLSPVEEIVAHSIRSRRVGVLLVRLGGHAAGIFEGATLVHSRVGSRQVHGRSAAGGWSQHRFARRREGQVRASRAAAADLAVAVLLPELARLEAVVTGGERGGVSDVLADARLAPLRPLVTGGLLDVPEPRLRVLQATPARFRAVRIRLVEPTAEG